MENSSFFGKTKDRSLFHTMTNPVSVRTTTLSTFTNPSGSAASRIDPATEPGAHVEMRWFSERNTGSGESRI